MEKPEKDKNRTRLMESFIRRMKQDKRFELAVYGVLIAAGMLVYVASGLRSEEGNAVEEQITATSFLSAAAETEIRLKTTLSCIQGAGRVEVMVTYEETDDVTSSTNAEYSESRFTIADSFTDNVMDSINNNDKNASEVKNGKVVRGVIVVAEGAGDLGVRMDLQNAVKTVLGVDTSRIEVFEMKTMEGE